MTQQQGSPLVRAFALWSLPLAWIAYMICHGADSTNSKPEITRPEIGQVGIISDGADLIPVGTSEEAYVSVVKAATAHDKVGFDNLIITGSAYYVDKGTQALVLDHGDNADFQVRISSGPHSSEQGWIAKEWITKP